MNNNNNMTVPYIVYESALDRGERRDKRHTIVIILLIVLLVVTNAMWLIAWNQYDYVDDYSVDVRSGNGGNANYIGGNGDINNGERNSDTQEIESSQEWTEQGNES